ncbi:phosphoadenosine phosphosulfate reductase family protein [Nocardiopsis synnemataformans]|uniref:phosphoadenosine phosphosulfate reductase domain-containing protein n=1 Tax=Nocardiopsis synnemataformans TaxID=61305 RepID=UPI003EB80D30
MSTLLKTPEAGLLRPIRLRPWDLAPGLVRARNLLTRADAGIIAHSGGKDSGAAFFLVASLAYEMGMLDKLTVLHNPLGILEWPGASDIARTHAEIYGLRFVERAADRDLLDEVRRRRMWPDALARYCTAFAKRGPGMRFVTEVVAALGLERTAEILYVLGLRAQESTARSKLAPVDLHKASSGRRTIRTWHPVLNMREDRVWDLHRRTGLPHHSAYTAGMSRLSCSFCVLSANADLIRACQLRPELAQTYADLEWEIGDSFKPTLSMLEAIARANDRPVDQDRLDLLKLRTKHNRRAYRLAKKVDSADAPSEQIDTLRATCLDLQAQMRALGYKGKLDRWNLAA